jgi:hypothetical protein
VGVAKFLLYVFQCTRVLFFFLGVRCDSVDLREEALQHQGFGRLRQLASRQCFQTPGLRYPPFSEFGRTYTKPVIPLAGQRHSVRALLRQHCSRL